MPTPTQIAEKLREIEMLRKRKEQLEEMVALAENQKADVEYIRSQQGLDATRVDPSYPGSFQSDPNPSLAAAPSPAMQSVDAWVEDILSGRPSTFANASELSRSIPGGVQAETWIENLLKLPSMMIGSAGEQARLLNSSRNLSELGYNLSNVAAGNVLPGMQTFVKAHAGDPEAYQAFQEMPFLPVLDVLLMKGMTRGVRPEASVLTEAARAGDRAAIARLADISRQSSELASRRGLQSLFDAERKITPPVSPIDQMLKSSSDVSGLEPIDVMSRLQELPDAASSRQIEGGGLASWVNKPMSSDASPLGDILRRMANPLEVGDPISNMMFGGPAFDPAIAGRTIADASKYIYGKIGDAAKIRPKDVIAELGDKFAPAAKRIAISAGARQKAAEAPALLSRWEETFRGWRAPEELIPGKGGKSPFEAERLAGNESLPSSEKALIRDEYIQRVKAAGIATRPRVVKGREVLDGKPLAMIRRSGTYVPEVIEGYENMNTGIGAVQTIPPDIMWRAIDNLPLGSKDAGFIERNVGHRVHETVKQRVQTERAFEAIPEADLGHLSLAQKHELGQILVDLQSRNVRVSVAARRALKSAPVEIREAAQAQFDMYSQLLAYQNKTRALMGESPIPSLGPEYFPLIKRGESVLDLARRWDEVHADRSPVNDINRNAPINPRAMERKKGDAGDFEIDPHTVALSYIRTAMGEIFNRGIIENNTSVAEGLRRLGPDYRRAADYIDEYTQRSFAGKRHQFDDALLRRPMVRKMAQEFRRARALGALTGNVQFLLGVQIPGGLGLGVGLAGPKNFFNGARKWIMGGPEVEAAKQRSYPIVVKGATGDFGSPSMQDAGFGMRVPAQSMTGKALNTMQHAAEYLLDRTEYHMTGMSHMAGLEKAKELGLTGDRAVRYADDIAIAAQNMYNKESRPLILQSEVTATLTPYQSFSLRAAWMARDMAVRGGLSKEAANQRLKIALNVIAAMTVGNLASQMISGRNQFDVTSLIPLYDQTLGPAISIMTNDDPDQASGRAQTSVIQVSADVARGIASVLETGDATRLIEAGLRHGLGFAGIPAGTQISRMARAGEAIAAGGNVVDASGRTIFKIDTPTEEARALAFGVYGTEAGQQYLNDKNNPLYEFIPRSAFGSEVVADVTEAVPFIGGMVKGEMSTVDMLNEAINDMVVDRVKFSERIDETSDPAEKADLERQASENQAVAERRINELVQIMRNEMEQTIEQR